MMRRHRVWIRSSCAAVVAVAMLFVPAVIAAPVAVAGTPPTETEGPSFNVNAANNNVDGGGWTHGMVTIQVWDSGFDTMLTSRTADPDGSGSFNKTFGGPGQPGTFDLTTGQRFVVTDGTDTKVLTDTDLEITGISYGGDFIEGHGAIASGVITVATGTEWPSTLPAAPSFNVTADASGDWTADLGANGVDLKPVAIHVAVQQTDTNGDTFGAEPPGGSTATWPHLVVGANRFVSATGYAFGDLLTLDITWPDTSTHHDERTMDLSGNVYFANIPKELVPGTVVTLDGPTPSWILDEDFGHRTLETTSMAISDINVGNSTMIGTAGPNRNVEIYPYEPNYQGPWVRRHTFTDGSGDYPVQNFAVQGDEPSEDGTLQLSNTGTISVSAFDEPDFDVQTVSRSNTLPSLNVMPNMGLSDGQAVSVNGQGFAPNSSVGFAQCVTDTTNCVLKDSLPTNAMGQFNGNVTVSRWVGGIDAGSAPGATRLVAFSFSDPYGHNAGVPLSFLPALGPMTVTVKTTGVVSDVSGWATISGTVKAPEDGMVTVNGTLWQRIDATHTAHAEFVVSLFVQGGVSVQWKAELAPAGDFTPFAPTFAEVRVHAEMSRWSDITSDDAVKTVSLNVTPTISIDPVTVAEGSGNASVAVTLSKPSTKTVKVHYATANGSAKTPADYQSTSGTLTFLPGETVKPVDVTIAPDLLDEADETFTVKLSAPTNAVIGTASATVTITDDDATPSITIGDRTSYEGNSGTKTFSFTLTLSAPSGRDITVAYSTADGTATVADNDYVAKSGTITIPASVVTKSIKVTVNGDAIVEPNESFNVLLSSPVNVTITDGSAVGLIKNDD